jgi:SnoaL-like domain
MDPRLRPATRAKPDHKRAVFYLETEHLPSLASSRTRRRRKRRECLKEDRMRLLEPVERYFEAWNSHDGGAIAACFDPDGGYTDPVSGQLPRPGSLRTRAACSALSRICVSNCT